MDTIIPSNSPQKKLNGYQEYYGSVHTVFLYTSREKPCHSSGWSLSYCILKTPSSGVAPYVKTQ